MQGEGLKGVKREFKLGHTIVTFQEATCVIIDCLYIVTYINKRKYDSVVLSCCSLSETKEDAHAIIRKENL